MTEGTRKLCECGCGQPTRISDRTCASEGIVKGQARRFIQGHYNAMRHARRASVTCGWCGSVFQVRPAVAKTRRYCSTDCSRAANTGERNSNYKGGLCFSKSEQRWVIWCRDNTSMLYARGVMAAQIGRLLRPDELVHHEDEDTTNDDPSNLTITTRADHLETHRAQQDRSGAGLKAWATRRARAAT